MSRGFVLRRVGNLLPVLIGVSLLTFGMLHLIPGDPAAIRAGLDAPPEQLEALREQMGLTDPLHVQFGRYVQRAVSGDFGRSFITGRSVGPELLRRFLFTLKLSALTMIVVLSVGITTGVIAALRRATPTDTGVMIVAMVSLAMPNFWLALMLMQLFAGKLGWLPAGGSGTWQHWIMPVFVLGTGGAAVITRITRSSMLDVLGQDFIRTLEAAGIERRRIVYRHVLRNALNPVITLAGLIFGFSLAGTVIVEVVFSLPGLGRMMVSGIFNRDFPIVQGGLLLLGTTFVFVNFLTDLLYGMANPRIRYE